MRIRTNDQELFTGTPEEIVEAMATTSRTYDPEAHGDPVLAYMQDVASRLWLWKTVRIHTTTAARFVEDLRQAGMLTVLEDDQAE